MNKRIMKILLFSVIAIVLLGIIIVVSLYIGNSTARLWIDKNIFRKDIGEEELPTIEIEESKTYIYAYGNRVVTLTDNKLLIYNNLANKVSTIDVVVTKPKFAYSGDYLLIADEGQSNLYLIYGDNMQWEKKLEGNISQITVNKNGAVGVVLSGTTYKSVIMMFDIAGEENFKTYLATTLATDLEISDNNNYLSFIEVNYSGASITSNVKTISVEKAKNKPNEAIIYTYDIDSNILPIKIKYKNNRIVLFVDNAVYVLDEGNKNKILDIGKNITFADIELNGYVCSINENATERGKYSLDLFNVENESQNAYFLSDTVKNIYCNNDNIIAMNLGNTIEFVNTNGWLVKKYTSLRNVQNIVIGKSIAAIIYKDRVEVLSL